MSLKDYLEKGFLRHEADYWAAVHIRAFAKWWLELARNFIVVAALVYLANKGDSLALKSFAYFTAAILLLYCTSHFNTWSFKFIPGIRNERLNRLVNLSLWTVVYGVAFWTATAVMAAVFKALVTVQGH